MKRVLLGVVVALVLLVGGVYLVGGFLPVDHRVTVAATIPAPLDSVQAAVTDVERLAAWRPSVDRVEVASGEPGPLRWTEVGSGGALPMELIEKAPGRVVVTIVGEDLPFGGRWIYELTDMDGGTRVSITEEGEVYSPIFRFVSRFVMGHHATATTYLEDLGRRFGGEVTVEVVA